MRLSRAAALILVGTLHFVVPLGLILWTWTRSYPSAAALAVQVLVLISYAAFIFLAGAWAFASFYLRYALLVLTAAVTVRCFLQVRNLPFLTSPHFLGWVGFALGIALTTVCLSLAAAAVRSYIYDQRPVDLVFPLRNGWYAVFEGGNGRVSSLMNYHYGSAMHKGARTNLSMRHAVDITRLSRWGNDADGFLPTENERYAVFNELVVSPCDGVVSDVEDKWPNQTPWTGTPPYNVGNHIVIESGDFAVLLGHLQQGSMQLKMGDRVEKGQPIARSGNSGWTSQPHLHIQAMKVSTGSFWGWEGLPVFFDGKNPVKNRLFRAR